MTAHCTTCHASLGRETQTALPGVGEELCIRCETNKRAKWMLTALPDPDTMAWSRLSEWEQGFILSVRAYFARHGAVTEAQYVKLEQVYEKDR